MGWANRSIRREQHRRFDHVAELTDVAGPLVQLEEGERAIVDHQLLTTEGLARLGREATREVDDLADLERARRIVRDGL